MGTQIQTDKVKFFDYLRSKEYKIVDDGLGKPNFMATFSLIPHYYISDKGNHLLISGIHVVDYGGVRTKEGDLGCVVINFDGVIRRKFKKNSYQEELLKKVFCPKTAKEAIKAFEQWRNETAKTLQSWKMVL